MGCRPAAFVAVDLGASSARVMLGQVGPDTLELTELHRVNNRPVALPEGLRWDILALYQAVEDGLRQASGADARSVGVDGWGVDFGLLDRTGRLLANPVHYRDSRTDGVMPRVLARLSAERIYAATGIQFMPINTLFQLVAAQNAGQLDGADRLLLVPDLLGFWLTGRVGAERTNASTTQLYDPSAGDWAWSLLDQVGLPAGLLPPLRDPGEQVGLLLPEVADRTGLPRTTAVTAVASHDTASAVVAIPAEETRFAYISAGTWSLVGVELDRPVLTEASRAANFTNEVGLDGTIRYLRNVMGLWLLQECVRDWAQKGMRLDVPSLVSAAAGERSLAAVFDPDDPLLLPPGGMPDRVRACCRAAGYPVPESPPAIVRSILDSLALAHRRALRDGIRLSGRDVDVVHVVGGGSRNALLCQLTADACGLPVIAGPAEATSLGNVLVQARALGMIGDLTQMRRLVRRTQRLTHYEPRGEIRRWTEAADAVERRSPV